MEKSDASNLVILAAPLSPFKIFFRKNILNGESGAARITKFDASDFSTTFAAELKGYDDISGLTQKETRRIDPFVQYALTASDQAITDANLALELNWHL